MIDYRAPEGAWIRRLNWDWQRITFELWLIAAAVMIFLRWQMINGFWLPDTDDNMRMMQVRGLLNGQAWFDLRQHALLPPLGANIHWSRLVDLPLAGIILACKPFFGVVMAEKIAATVAPLLPLWVAMLAQGAIIRRLVSNYAYPLACGVMLCGWAAMVLFMPMRIDHHGWQLAFLTLSIAGLVDDNKVRGGLLTGIFSALSLTIGLEMIAFLALGGATAVLLWVLDERERLRLRTYGLSLALVTAVGYYGFASYDNRQMVCDALSPIWMQTMLAASALAFLLSWIKWHSTTLRFLLAALGGAALGYAFYRLWPACLMRPEHVSPEVYTLWLSNVREAKPILSQSHDMILATLTLPFLGALGTLGWWLRCRLWQPFLKWLVIALFMGVSLAFVFWQTRMGAAAAMIAVPGATALLWGVLGWLFNARTPKSHVLGVLAVLLGLTGTAFILRKEIAQYLHPQVRQSKPSTAGLCWSQPALAQLNALPAATIFTHVDLAPRLITMTHHHAIIGPYHRNGAGILDVYHGFGGTADQARTLMDKYHATYLLTCPGMSETTVYHNRWPGGFYDQLVQGQAPAWLSPVALPAGSPFKLWAIVPSPLEIKNDHQQTHTW